MVGTDVPADAIDNGDGTWSHPRRSTIDIEELGALTWVYVEQARYPYVRECVDEYSFTVTDERPLPLVDRLLRAERHHDGEIWKVGAVNEALLDPEVVELAARQVEEWVPAAEGEVGHVESWVPNTSWTHMDCDLNGANDVHVWGVESRDSKEEPYTDRQQSAVAVEVALSSGGYSYCSGVLIRKHWVLTAAHCLQDNNGRSVRRRNG